jgi:hypothetical protein
VLLEVYLVRVDLGEREGFAAVVCLRSVIRDVVAVVRQEGAPLMTTALVWGWGLAVPLEIINQQELHRNVVAPSR